MLDAFPADPAQLISLWCDWGVIIAFAVTFVTTLWIFFDSQSNNYEARACRLVSLISAMIVIPSAVLSLFFPTLVAPPGLLVIILAILGALATLSSLLILVLYTLRVGVKEWEGSDDPLTYDPIPLSHPVGEAKSRVAGNRHNHAETPAQEPTTPILNGGEDATQRIDAPPDQALTPLAWLVTLTGPEAGKAHPLGDVTDIGRDSKHNAIRLDDRTISRQHARVRLENGEFVLYDLASANGVSINGEPVQRQVLHNGDRILVGQSLLGFMQVQEELAPWPEPVLAANGQHPIDAPRPGDRKDAPPPVPGSAP